MSMGRYWGMNTSTICRAGQGRDTGHGKNVEGEQGREAGQGRKEGREQVWQEMKQEERNARP
jgi:hypothetical protein